MRRPLPSAGRKINSQMPTSSIFDWDLAGYAGNAAFLNSKTNINMRYILNDWTKHLSSLYSRYMFNTGKKGWIGGDAMVAMYAHGNQSHQVFYHWKVVPTPVPSVTPSGVPRYLPPLQWVAVPLLRTVTNWHCHLQPRIQLQTRRPP